ncbi:MAG TPA: hypothetical protein VFJ15_01005, partial [Oleiagrimonas sp.]|nr:hypothetical protein [Oleiagrimonas sp.]
MKSLSRNASIGVFVALAVAMVATRYHHFGSVLHLPDASMAVFFLGGLYLRKHLQFLGFLALSVVIDWLSVGVMGNSAFCITAAYAFLPLAYGALWYAGRGFAASFDASKWSSLALTVGVAFLGASVSYLISNGSFYWLGGRYADPHFAEYVARAWQWGPMFVRTTLT